MSSEMNVIEQLSRLCASGAPSGFEKSFSKSLLAEQPDGCAEQYVDRMGNLIRRFPCGKENAPLLLLDAHLDEIGLIVMGYDKGFLRFDELGGVDPRMLPGRAVRVLTDPPISGIVTAGLDSEEGEALEMKNLRIDIGCSGEETKKRVPVGTAVCYEEGGTAFGENRFCGKSLDDRSCYLQLLRAMELAPAEQRAVDVVVVGSVKEETGGEGAVTSCYALDPDYCIACDVTFASTSDCLKQVDFALGSGPAIGTGPNMAKWMTDLMITKAKELGMSYNLEVMSGNTGTNGWELQITREGIPTGILSLPLRYMHTPVEVIDLADFENGAKLLAAVICAIGREGTEC